MSRTVFMTVLENEINGVSSVIVDDKENPRYKRSMKLKANLAILDKEWFETFNPQFSKDKYEEELGELENAFIAYSVSGSSNKNILSSLKYAFIGELSDFVLVASSCLASKFLTMEKISADITKLKKKFSDHMESYNGEMADINVTADDILDHHLEKTEELLYAMRVYLDVVDGKPSKWYSALLKLYTPDELIDPSNKADVSKLIRRWYFLKNNL